MPRDASGNMTLTAGNPVLAGTPIDPLWANLLTEDLRNEMQQSLSRQGYGGMVAPLRTQDGTALAPAHSFTNDTDSGMYLGAANDVRMAVGAAEVARFTATAVTFAIGATATGIAAGIGLEGIGGATSGIGVKGTGGAPNGVGVSGVGDGTGAGVTATGGDASGDGLAATGGATNGVGVRGTGSGTGAGGVFLSAGTGKGVTGTGAGTAVGGEFANGTAATAAARQDALALTNGDLNFTGVANPNNNVGHSNKLGPKNICKAWARLTTNGAGGLTINDGFNVQSAAIDGGTTSLCSVQLVTAVGGNGIAVGGIALAPNNQNTAKVNLAGSGTRVDFSACSYWTGAAFALYDLTATADVTFEVVVYGAQ